MAIQYSGLTVRNDLYAGLTTSNGILTDINTTLVAAGWTSTTLHAFTALSLGSLALNTETVTLDGKVYTFKTVINNANNGDVLIGASAAACLVNLKAAVNLGTGSGTLYSAATTANTTLQAGPITATQLVIQQIAAGASTGLAVSETLTSGSFVSPTANWTGFKCKSILTSSGLDCTFYFFNAQDGDPTIRVLACNSSETNFSKAWDTSQLLFNVGPTFDVRVIADAYQCFVFENLTTATARRFWGMGVPWIPNFLEGETVNGATNATPIVISTTAAHGYTTGDSVTIRGVLGNTAANCTNTTVTVITTTTFSIDGSVGTGAYVSGGRSTKVGLKIVEAIWAEGTASSGYFFRSSATNSSNNWTALNGSTVTDATGAGSKSLATINNNIDLTQDLTWFNGSYLVTEPFLCFSTSSAAAGTIIGQLWDMVFIRKALTVDITGSFDSHNWWNLSNNITTVLGGGSFLVVVP